MATTTTTQNQNIPLSDSDILNQITGNQGSGLSGVLNQLFYAGLILAVVLAIFMIIRGGLEYMTIDIASSKEAAKNRIKAALGGLILCFSTILILNTINPGLTTLQLNFPRLNKLGAVEFNGQKLEVIQRNTDGTSVAVGADGQTYTVGADGGVVPTTNAVVPPGRSDNEVRAYFAQHGVAVKNNRCATPDSPSCTSVEMLGESAMRGVVALKEISGANDIIITGGTEGGGQHKTHGRGLSIVDLGKNSSTLNKYIINNQIGKSVEKYTTYTLPGGATYMDEGDHWHVVYK